MSPEELIGRVQALEWLLKAVLADGISRAAVPATAAAAFRSVVVGRAGTLLELARAQGDTPEARQTAAFAHAVVSLGAVVVNAAAAGMADAGGARN